MRNGFPGLLVLLATLTHQAAAITGSDQTLINAYNAPVHQHGERINYQFQDIQRQQTNQPSNASPQKISALVQHADTTHNIKSGVAPDSTFLNTNIQTDSTLTSVLEVFGLGAGIGIQGMLSGDFNNDGVTELVLGNPDSIVFAQAVEGKFGLQRKLQFPEGIGKLAYFRDLSTDGHFAFFSNDGKLHKLDLITRRVTTILELAGISSYRIQAGSDLSSAVLIVRTQSGLVNIIDPTTMKIVSSQAGINADIVALGSFTEKNSTQILLANGQIYDLKNNKFTLVKTLIEKNHNFTGTVDINGDGLDEILAADHWYVIKLYSPHQEEIIWSKKTALDIAVVIMADVDHDGQPDGVYGDGQWGGLHAFNLQTGEGFWDISNPEHGVTNIVIADLDNDGKQDISWGAGYSSSGADYLFIHDFASKEKIWQSEDIQFPMSAVSMVDVDQDGDLDLVSASEASNSGYNGGILQAFDIKSKTRLWHNYAAADNWGRTMNLAAADLDNDGTKELIIGASQIYTGMVRVLNAADGSEQYKTLLGDGDAVSSLTTADLNQDGFYEIIVGNNAVHSGSAGVFFRVLNGRTGQVLQQSPSLGFYWQGLTDLTPIELNGNRFVYGLVDGNLHQYNFSNNSVKQLSNAHSYRQLTSVVIEGVAELVVTDSHGKLLRLSGSGNVIATATVCGSAVNGLSGAGPDRVLFTCNDNLNEYNLTTQSNAFSHATGFTTLGDPKLVRHNNQDQIVVGGQKVAVYQMEATVALPAPEPVRLTSHVLKALNGTLKISTEIDYFALSSGTKLGQFTFTDRKTGQFTYQPTGGTGTETLKFYAVKGKQISIDAELTIELINNKPVVDNLNISTHWDKAVQLTLPAKDDDQEALIFTLASEPKHGQLKLLDPAKGTVEYIPSGDSLDAVSFGFTAKDSLVSSDQKNVVVTLTNTTPVANAISYTTSYLTPVNGAVKGQDADNDALSYEITAQPASGSLTLDSGSGLFVYTPSGENDQQISFSYVVKDKFASSAAQTVSITVKGAPKKSSGGAFSLFSVIALLLLAIRRRRLLLD